jgi:phospholipase C
LNSPKRISRRELLKLAAAAGAASASGSLLAGCGAKNAIQNVTGSGSSSCAKLTDIEHVVIFMQENRSFDHYFGTYRGVRGFADASTFYRQPYPANTTSSPAGVLMPFHLDTTKPDAACTQDIAHDWVSQHLSWHNGAMDGFLTSKSGNGPYAVNTMGYYTRADLQYFYAVADAFTLCDNYFCSVLGPTDPNRLYSMAGSIDPDGKNGGPLLETLFLTRASFYGKLTYTTMPEQLQARGISWKVYSAADQNIANGVASNNVLPYFKNFLDTTSPLYKQGMVPSYPTDFVADVAAGNLPQVSWIVGSVASSEHPPGPSVLGEVELSAIMTTLMANPVVWGKTVLFLSYDENGGFFDHVVPPTAPPGTPGEYVTATAVPDASSVGSPAINGPIGLGFRVPLMIISPFSRGGFVSSGVFDHTSILRFLETRFGAEVPNLSAWRRSAVGDLTSAFNFTKLDTSIPKLPSVADAVPAIVSQCTADQSGLTPYPIPNPQSMPAQESGGVLRPSGPC